MPDSRYGTWRHDEVNWGLTECQRPRCGADARVLFEGLPLCTACADEWLERFVAVGECPELADVLPHFFEAA